MTPLAIFQPPVENIQACPVDQLLLVVPGTGDELDIALDRRDYLQHSTDSLTLRGPGSLEVKSHEVGRADSCFVICLICYFLHRHFECPELL